MAACSIAYLAHAATAATAATTTTTTTVLPSQEVTGGRLSDIDIEKLQAELAAAQAELARKKEELKKAAPAGRASVGASVEGVGTPRSRAAAAAGGAPAVTVGQWKERKKLEAEIKKVGLCAVDQCVF